ncbi:MAG: imidazolonepropionase, partial [Steroidobacteraceae bacterium]|nr:imidazolonepropionase [Steroidobacteraceae bacterium]
QLPVHWRSADALQRCDLRGLWLTPALIDCHTHLIFAGHRADEHAARRAGATYAEIAARGGGIAATVRATRAASDELLAQSAAARITALQAEGVTCVEIKSGYGLDFVHERRQLLIARQLARHCGIEVSTSFLALHALPEEYAGRADEYVARVCDDWLPKLCEEGLIDCVDAYCETLGFSPAQCERLFAAAQRLGLPVRLHAEQFANIGASLLAARWHARCCDHLEYAGEAEAAAFARSGTVAVLLPIAFFALDETRRPPVGALRQHRVPIAIATDCNPGSAPSTSIQLAMHLAMRYFGLTSAECLAAVTRHAARALGLHEARGRLAVGMRADFALWDIESPAELGYWIGHNRCRGTVVAGVADARLSAALQERRS